MDCAGFSAGEAVHKGVPAAVEKWARAAEGAHQGRCLAAPYARGGRAFQGRRCGLADTHRQGIEEGGGALRPRRSVSRVTRTMGRAKRNPSHAPHVCALADQAAFLRLISSRASTSATPASMTG